MLVYANSLTLHGRNAENVVFRAIGAWLKEQLGFGLHPEQLKQDGQHNGTRGQAPSWLRVYATSDELPRLYAWILKNSDNEVRGRQWITELGIKITENDLEVSCVVRSDELSTLIADRVSASRPRVIQYIVNNVRRSKSTEFASSVLHSPLKTVGKNIDSYRGLYELIDRPDRNYPIVLVSPTTSGKYLLNTQHLQKMLFGLAQVVKVAIEYNSYDMEEVLGRPWSAWDGAINVLHTRTKRGFIHGQLFRSNEIEKWGNTQHDKISQVLAWVTNNTNIPHFRSRIRPEGVAQLAMRRRLEAIQERSAEMNAEQLRTEIKSIASRLKEQTELADLFEGDNDRLEAELERAKANIENLRAELNKKEYSIQGLQSQLTGATGGRSISVTVMDKLVDFACQSNPTPSDCLDAVQSMFGDTCVILETARKSAADMDNFTHGRRLFSMLKRLVINYRDALVSGGDNQARKCFTRNEFAARESESTANNKDLLRARTFEYEGKRVVMQRHLKIGIEDDETKTIRVHFHWDSERKRIVIGYCGSHLPIPSR